MRVTFEEYDHMIEKFNKVNTHTYFPSIEDMDIMEADPDKWIPLLCYFIEKGEEPKTNEEQYSRKTMVRFVNKNLELVDSDTD